MITCTNCGHSNPEGAITCEACYVELPKMSSCPSCQAQVPEDAVFCSQCGTSLQQGAGLDMATAPTQVNAGQGVPTTDVVMPSPAPSATPPEQIEMTEFHEMDLGFASTEVTPPLSTPPMPVELSEQPTKSVMPSPPLSSPLPTPPDLPDLDEPASVPPPVSQSPVSQPPVSQPPVSRPPIPPPPAVSQPPAMSMPPSMPPANPPAPAMEFSSPPMPEPPSSPVESGAAETPISSSQQSIPKQPIPKQPSPPPGSTQLQLNVATLLHERTNTTVDLPSHLSLIHMGKPNDRIPPDIDVSGFPDSDVVSRVHADIRVDPDGYYLEDTGSANGTYVNNQPLRPGNRYRLRAGDRISLGKEDKVSFIFNSG